jgi:hypothetical protein
LRGNREPIIPRTLKISVVTCVSVYLGVPKGPQGRHLEGARNGLQLTVTTNTPLVSETVSALRERAAPCT